MRAISLYIESPSYFPSPFLYNSHDRYHMFMHAFCTVSLPYAIIFFSNSYTTSGHMTITAQNARARRALQPRGYSVQKLVFDIASVINKQKSCIKKD